MASLPRCCNRAMLKVSPRLPLDRRRRSVVLGGLWSLFEAAKANTVTMSAGAVPTRINWAEASPESQGISAPALTAALDSAAGVRALRSVLVARNGHLVAERYYGGATATQLLPINSATKSVTSMLVGQALANGRLRSLSQTVGELIPGAAEMVPGSPALALSLRQILTGTTGLKYDFRTQYLPLMRSSDPIRYVLNLPLDGAQADTWSYNDAAISLLSSILEHAHGTLLESVVQNELFGPLGIDQFQWSRGGGSRVMAYAGLELRTQDLLKLAWVMADGGQWRGTRVLGSGWVADSIQPKVNTSWGAPPLSETGYGYLWFTGMVKDRPVAWAWGYGAQFAFVVPSLQLAIATAAKAPPPRELGAQNAAVMELVARIVEAVS